MTTLGERLIQLKKERNLLQKDIAKATGLSLRAYQYYERDQKDPTSAVLQKLADYFDVSTDYLLGRSDNP
ncbi:MAG: helix-turn-helix domain-containing protein [Defluviitaleaceae bacterium]|nr:helix-turn-helix domain-containing protein [Defluviitaleaceae bacterium]